MPDKSSTTVYLVGGIADVYATEALARAAIVKAIRGSAPNVIKGSDRDLVLFLLDQGRFDDALRTYNRCCPREWMWGISEQDIRGAE